MMDHVSRASPFWIAGLLVLCTLPLALSIRMPELAPVRATPAG
jgi:hypothetical protein